MGEVAGASDVEECGGSLGGRGSVTISEGRAVCCWWRPRTVRVWTWVARVSMAGVRRVTNAEW